MVGIMISGPIGSGFGFLPGEIKSKLFDRNYYILIREGIRFVSNFTPPPPPPPPTHTDTPFWLNLYTF